MPNIITITFNPAIDKSTTVESIVPDKKLRCKAPQFQPGGGGINVARALKKLGGEAIAIYPAGGHTGIFFNKMLHDEGIKTQDIKTVSYTRENLVVRDESTNQQYRFGMPGSALQQEEWIECLEVLKSMKDIDFIIASGSLPPGVPLNIYADISTIAKQKNTRLIVDTSGEALKHAAEAGVYLLKPNLGELSAITGKKYIEPNEIEAIAGEFIRKGRCEIMIVSMGENGAWLISKDQSFHVKPPLVDRKSTVGAGDSMVAGLVLGLVSDKSLKETLKFGVAAGTAATMNTGTELCKLEDTLELYNKLVNNSP
jgi:6-phosphofructokinase 2